MKALVALASCLTWCTAAVAQCVVIWDTKPSSRDARLLVLFDGKPRGKAKLTISLPAGQGSRSLVTDSQGAAMLKDLPSGTTCITAAAEGNFSAGLCLEVSAQPTGEVSAFQMTLTPPRPNPLDEKVRRVEQRPPTRHFRVLAGVVVDPAGAVIPLAEIQIFKRGSYPREPVMTLNTDDGGRFSASVEPGLYIVIERKLGFQPECQFIEISPTGKDDELRQLLQVKPTDTCDEANEEVELTTHYA